jgi:hypothetical protein
MDHTGVLVGERDKVREKDRKGKVRKKVGCVVM